MKINFCTQFNRISYPKTCSGSRMRAIYSPVFDKNGHFELEVTGEEDIYIMIQSDKLSCDINNIIRRYTSGDVTALGTVQGVYGDFTNIPQSYAEILNSLIHAENEFRKLPLDIRSKFNHSWQEWLSSMGSDEFKLKMGIVDKNDDNSIDLKESVEDGKSE